MSDETKKEEVKPVESKPATYRDKIKNILDRVNKNEQIFPKPPKANPLHKAVKENGLRKTITQIFTESIGDYTINEDENIQIPNTDYVRVNIPSEYKIVDSYWESLIPRFRNMGKVSLDPAGSAQITMGNTGNPKENLTVYVVRNEKQANKPGLIFSYTDTKQTNSTDIKTLLDKVGLGYEPSTIKDLGDKVYIEVLA